MKQPITENQRVVILFIILETKAHPEIMLQKDNDYLYDIDNLIIR
jgi:hypothetical protein